MKTCSSVIWDMEYSSRPIEDRCCSTLANKLGKSKPCKPLTSLNALST